MPRITTSALQWMTQKLNRLENRPLERTKGHYELYSILGGYHKIVCICKDDSFAHVDVTPLMKARKMYHYLNKEIIKRERGEK